MGFLLRICTAINKRGPRVLNSEKEKPYFHPLHRPLTVNQDFGDTSLPTLGWGKQSTWLAASGSLAHLRAQPAPTPGETADAHRKTPVAAVWALCAGFGMEAEAAPLRGHLGSVGLSVRRPRGAPAIRKLYLPDLLCLGKF